MNNWFIGELSMNHIWLIRLSYESVQSYVSNRTIIEPESDFLKWLSSENQIFHSEKKILKIQKSSNFEIEKNLMMET